MGSEWGSERQSARTAAALTGAVLGGALGADSFLAAGRSLGAPAVLCGAVLAFFAVKGGALFSDRNSRAGTLLALLPVVLWGCLANHLSFALAAAHGDPAAVWNVFLSLEPLTAPDSARRYWLRLAGLLGTALAVWIVLFLLAGREERLIERAFRPCRRTFDPPPADLELYLPKHEWIRPFRLQRRIAQGLWLAVFLTCGWMEALVGGGPAWSRSMGAMLLGLPIVVPFFTLSHRICSAERILFVRRGDRLWRVDMKRIVDPELGAPLSRLIRMWDRLPQTRRSGFKSAAAAIQTGIASFELIHPHVMAQSKWEWAVSGVGGGSVYIPKVYPGFSPVPRDAGPLRERSPLRWGSTVCTLLVTAVCLAAGFFIGWVDREEGHHPSVGSGPPAESVLPEPELPDPATTVRIPKEIGHYYLNGLTLLTDDAFQASTTGFRDQENDVYYHIALRYGVSEDAALCELEKTVGEQPRYLRDSGDFLWGMGENGVVYRYDLRSVVLSDGQMSHTGVALSERGTLIILDCVHGGDTDTELVRGTLLYMLENLQFTGPAITEDNYWEQLRPAVSMGFNYCGQAFFKAPPGMFEYHAFIDTFLPCGGKVNYYDDGISMMTKVHGLRVSAAVVPNEGTAMDVVEQAYQDLKAAGRQYDEQELFQDACNEEGSSACRATVYYDGGRTRVTVLAAMEESEGWYLFKELTCLPEEIDGEYQAVFKEMEAACGIEVSVMETLGRSGG